MKVVATQPQSRHPWISRLAFPVHARPRTYDTLPAFSGTRHDTIWRERFFFSISFLFLLLSRALSLVLQTFSPTTDPLLSPPLEWRLRDCHVGSCKAPAQLRSWEPDSRGATRSVGLASFQILPGILLMLAKSRKTCPIMGPLFVAGRTWAGPDPRRWFHHPICESVSASKPGLVYLHVLFSSPNAASRMRFLRSRDRHLAASALSLAASH